MPIFESQTLFDLILDTNVNLSSATTTNIKYTKPDGTQGTFSGTAYETTKVKYEVQANDLNAVGVWKFQAVVVIGGRIGYGEIIPITIDAKL